MDLSDLFGIIENFDSAKEGMILSGEKARDVRVNVSPQVLQKTSPHFLFFPCLVYWICWEVGIPDMFLDM
jgi:hypothetical protein